MKMDPVDVAVDAAVWPEAGEDAHDASDVGKAMARAADLLDQVKVKRRKD